MNEIKTPKISVIVPVYNVEKYIHQCIDSILGQTFTDFELLLIDDGSPDNCGAICDEYAAKDSRVRVFHQNNAGVSAARNKGLDEARGEWISFVDSDDWIDITHLSNVIPVKDKAIDIVFWGYILENKQSVVNNCLPDKTVCSGEIYHVISYLEDHQMFGWTWNKLFKLDLINKHNLRFLSNLNIQEDHIFTLSYFMYIKKLRLLPTAGYHYRLRSDSLMRGNRCWSQLLLKSFLLFNYRNALLNVGPHIDNKQFAKSEFINDLFNVISNLYYNTTSRSERLNVLRIVRSALKTQEKFNLKRSLQINIKQSLFCYFDLYLIDFICLCFIKSKTIKSTILK